MRAWRTIRQPTGAKLIPIPAKRHTTPRLKKYAALSWVLDESMLLLSVGIGHSALWQKQQRAEKEAQPTYKRA